jgi:pimeloyl-ACP methyl ester carboxylesterase
LAAIFATLHPDRVRGLVLLEAPAKFGPAACDAHRHRRAIGPATVYYQRRTTGVRDSRLQHCKDASQ